MQEIGVLFELWTTL